MAKRKYEVTHKIRIERRKVIKIGAVLELDAGRAHEWRHALRPLPEDAQHSSEQTSTTEQVPQEESVPTGAAAEDGAEAVEDDRERDSEAGADTSEVEAQQLEATTESLETAQGGPEQPAETAETQPSNTAAEETFVYLGEARVTDAARVEAERRGIDLSHVRATGAGNTLTKSDVQREYRRMKAEREAEGS